jgi:hypothetical protein
MAKITFIIIRKPYHVYSPKKNIQKESFVRKWVSFDLIKRETEQFALSSNLIILRIDVFGFQVRRKKKGINKKWTKKVSFWFRDNVASNQFSWEKQTAKSWHPLQLDFIFIFNGNVQINFLTITCVGKTSLRH